MKKSHFSALGTTLLVGSLALLTLTACGGKDDVPSSTPTSEPTSSAASAPVSHAPESVREPSEPIAPPISSAPSSVASSASKAPNLPKPDPKPPVSSAAPSSEKVPPAASGALTVVPAPAAPAAPDNGVVIEIQ